jgi:hypothetical protein
MIGINAEIDSAYGDYNRNPCRSTGYAVGSLALLKQVGKASKIA